MTVVGLSAMAVGSCFLTMLPTKFGIPGDIAPLVVITAGYALFQSANNTAVMTNIQPDQRGVTSGMLNLSRNLGLITGASVMGTVFALGSATTNIRTAPPGPLRPARGSRSPSPRLSSSSRSHCGGKPGSLATHFDFGDGQASDSLNR